MKKVVIVKVTVLKINDGFVHMEIVYNPGTIVQTFSVTLAEGDTANIETEGFVLPKFMEN
jgi:hypothetical protein